MDEKNLEYYYRLSFPKRGEITDNCISLIQPSISGGRITTEQIDVLKKHPHLTEIIISGLVQDTFEYFIENYGQQFRMINFWKCPLISDFTKLEQLTKIEYVLFFWNQRVSHLWDLSKNQRLKGIAFDDFTRMHTLEEIPLAPALEELYFGDKVWNKYILESLKPLCNAPHLKTLVFSSKKIEDDDVTPLAQIKNLESLEFSARLFTTEQVAWLTAKLPSVRSSVLVPYKILEHPLEFSEEKKDVLVIGKRKPFLNSQKDNSRLTRYEKDFFDLVKKFSDKGEIQG